MWPSSFVHMVHFCFTMSLRLSGHSPLTSGFFKTTGTNIHAHSKSLAWLMLGLNLNGSSSSTCLNGIYSVWSLLIVRFWLHAGESSSLSSSDGLC